MLISSFLSSTGGQGSEPKHFSLTVRGAGSFKQAIMYDCKKKSNEKLKGDSSNMELEWLLLCNTLESPQKF